MLKSNTTSTNKVLIVLYVLIFFLSIIKIPAQTEQENAFNDSLKKLVNTHAKDYTTIEALFSNFRYDSIKMKQLAIKANASNYFEAESYALNSLGIIYRNISFYEKAIAAHQKAKEAAEQAKNIELEVISLNLIGVVYRRMDIIKLALDFHKRALDIANAIEAPSKEIKHSIAVSQNSMGNIYLALKQYDLALEQFNKSLVIEKESNNKLGLAINYQNIGYSKEAKGLLKEALIDYKTSLDHNNTINSEVGRVICFNRIAQVYIKQEKYNTAKPIIEEALEKALKIGDPFYIASSYTNLGWAQNQLNLDKASETNLKKALEIGENYGLKTSIVEANQHLSELYTKKGEHEKALIHYKNAIELEQTISNDRNFKYVNDVIVQYENEIKNTEIRNLANENEIVKSKLERNKKIFWYSLLGLILIAGGFTTLNRQRQLNQEKQILTLEQDILRSQMNPHFIFNSLNSIKLYIINNEKENAVYYLNKFSKLIRKILIASTEKEMSLEEELDTMKLYMNIENIRFSNSIEFKIEVEQSINIANIKVPSLILQPFLENALWHGLSSKNEDKTILLNVFKTSDEYITVAITDNGIGRKVSEKINKDKLIKRKSLGIALTNARLANFSKSYSNQYKINIEDLYDAKKNPIGTKIIIDIPIKSLALKTA